LTLINKKFHYAGSSISWGLFMFVFFLSHLAYLLVLPSSEEFQAGGVGLVLYLVFLTQFNDVSQYVWGKSFGQHKIIPKVSENKTWEGFLGGVFTTTLLAVLLSSFLTPLSFTMAIFAGLIISLAGFLGDITISALKRDLEIKDTGQLLPGHGGILDRIDSLTYSAPLFFHFIYYFYFRT
jgi:phosphatidate cytidylyltransferase